MSEVIKALILLITGLLVGFGFYKLALRQIKVRCEKLPYLAEDYSPDLLKPRAVIICWEIAFALLFALCAFVAGNPLQIIYYLICISCIINISMVDLSIRRIPNELLLALLVSRLAYILLNWAVYHVNPKEELILSAIGIVCGFVLYTIPARFGTAIGSGDIKLSAVIGFLLGVVGYIQAMLIMAAIMLIYLIYLLATKKGNGKSYAPMGPALAAGALASLIYPALSGSIKLF